MKPPKDPPLYLQEAARRGFDDVAEPYGARPEYPPQLFEVLYERCALQQGSKVLEVGPGTGQATLSLAVRGLEITAVELGPALGERLREVTRELPVTVVIGSFEATDVATAFFDAVISATAFHWVDPEIGYAKAASALRDGGWLALWWTLFDQPDRPDAFFGDLEALLAEVEPHVLAMLEGPPAYCLDVDARRREFSATGEFGEPETLEFTWDHTHTPNQLRQLFSTYSPVMALPDERRERLLDNLESLAAKSPGGMVTRTYTTVMYLAERRARLRVG